MLGGGGEAGPTAVTAEAPNSSNVKSDKHVLMTGPFWRSSARRSPAVSLGNKINMSGVYMHMFISRL